MIHKDGEHIPTKIRSLQGASRFRARQVTSRDAVGTADEWPGTLMAGPRLLAASDFRGSKDIKNPKYRI